MADRLKNMVFTRLATLIWAVKLILLFVGFISPLLFFKIDVIPYTSDLILSTLSISPTFLFIIVNLIIFAIVVCSLSKNQSNPQPSDGEIATSEDFKMTKEEEEEEEEEEKQMIWNLSSSNDKTVTYPPSEGPLEKYFFPDSGAAEGNDSLEATWKAIMEGKGKNERQLKKSETLGFPSRNLKRCKPYAVYGGDDDGDGDPLAWEKTELKKSETFNDGASYRREKGMSEEGLKQRSEVFIDKIKTELQRLDSTQRFLLRHR